MLNMNSVVVQNMLKNTPEGFGNLPTYFGNGPTITTETIPVSQQQQNINQYSTFQGNQFAQTYNYQQPVTGYSNNFVGGYNNGFQKAFEGYYNPYMDNRYNQADPYGYQNYNSGYINPFYDESPGYNENTTFLYPPDEESKQFLRAAYNNGYFEICDTPQEAYMMQIRTESKINKLFSRIASKLLGRSEEEAKRCEQIWEVYNKYENRKEEQEVFKKKDIGVLRVVAKEGDRIVGGTSFVGDNPRHLNFYRSRLYAENLFARSEMLRIAYIERWNMMYDNAPERMFDHMDLVDFFNKGAPVLISDSLQRDLKLQRMQGASKTYNKELFRSLLEKNGLRTKKQDQYIEKYANRYIIRGHDGIMPGGIPVSPGVDPRIAECFSLDLETGTLNISAPKFITDRLDRAKDAFMSSIDNN